MLDVSPQIHNQGAGSIPELWQPVCGYTPESTFHLQESKFVCLVFLHGTRRLWSTKFRASDGSGEKEGTIDLGIHLK